MVHRTEVARAIVMIARRRAKVDDRHRDLLPDSEDSDPREVLDYLRKFSGPDIPRWVLQAEVSDALTLNNWLWWEDRRRELFFLKAGRARGVFLSQLGAQVGVVSKGCSIASIDWRPYCASIGPTRSSLGRPARLHGLRIIAGLSRRAGSTSTALSC